MQAKTSIELTHVSKSVMNHRRAATYNSGFTSLFKGTSSLPNVAVVTASGSGCD